MHDWAEIRRQYGEIAFASAYRILKRHDQALDCYQEVFVEALQLSTERQVDNWPGLLRWIAVKRALDRRRKERRITARIESDIETADIAFQPPHPSEELEAIELLEQIRDEIARFPELQGQAFWLRCVEECSMEEVAAQLGVEPNHVGVLVFRARSKLKAALVRLSPERSLQ